MEPRELLKIENLEVRFRSDQAKENAVVRGFNLEIFPGETLALVGESGCGKTTLAYAILRLIDFSGQIVRGKIFYREENLLKLPEPRLRQIRWKEIAMIFQEPASALNPLRRVGRQVTEALRLHRGLDDKAAKQITLQLFESVSLPEASRCFDAYPHELSAGMRQRVMIAMAISCAPKLLIADEPTTALDVRIQQEVLACLLRLKQEMGLTLLFITHDLGMAEKFADRLAIMHQGKIIEIGATTAILERPEHPQTLRLLQAAQRFSPEGFSKKGKTHPIDEKIYKEHFPQRLDEPNG